MATHNDGGVVFGTQVIEINEVNYVASDISLDTPVSEITRLDEVGEPDGQVFIQGVTTGSANLQLAAATTPMPVFGEEFSLVTLNAVSITVIVKTIGLAKSQNGETKVPITFNKKLAA